MPPSSGGRSRRDVGGNRAGSGMSPGFTFERVYLALKQQLREGRYPPGTQLEPRVLTEELNSSITPIRDALHRLVGERLVEAPRNDGFRVPLLSELMLRELYSWQVDLLRLALAHPPPERREEVTHAGPGAEVASAADIFLEIGRSSGNYELMSALGNVCDRLAALRCLEARYVPDIAEEFQALRELLEEGDPAPLRTAIASWHRRRDRAVPQLVAALHRPF